jgi:5-methyltetrahydropteroyltriglutamate--homocysteine methyltransferase
MNTGIDRILTTHVGSLPRPKNLLDLMAARTAGEPLDEATYDSVVTAEIAGIVKKQTDAGLDIVGDGELSKTGFFLYVRDRLEGFEPRPDKKIHQFHAEVAAFPEYYSEYFARAMFGGGVIAPVIPLFCVGPVKYVGKKDLQKDLENLGQAVSGVDCVGAFVPSTAPSGVGYNDYYQTNEEFFEAVAEAMRVEYLAIVEAGFSLQIDDPFLTDIFVDPELDDRQRRKKADLYVEGINHALRGIPEGKVRFHTCYGINEGPRIHEAALADVVGHMLQINAGTYSFEAANPRHEHEYHVWENGRLPDGKAIMPGVIAHANNIVEHPELIAEWLVRFAGLVGRENVIAGADCGFSSQACYHTEVHPSVVWAKFEAMAEGAKLASEKLW